MSFDSKFEYGFALFFNLDCHRWKAVAARVEAPSYVQDSGEGCCTVKNINLKNRWVKWCMFRCLNYDKEVKLIFRRMSTRVVVLREADLRMQCLGGLPFHFQFRLPSLEDRRCSCVEAPSYVLDSGEGCCTVKIISLKNRWVKWCLFRCLNDKKEIKLIFRRMSTRVVVLCEADPRMQCLGGWSVLPFAFPGGG